MNIEITNATINFTEQQTVSVSSTFSFRGGSEYFSGIISIPMTSLKSMDYDELKRATRAELMRRLAEEGTEEEA